MLLPARRIHKTAARCAALLLLLLLPLLLGAAPVPARDARYVVDETGRLTADHREFMEAASASLAERTGAELVVLLVDSTGALSPGEYARQVFDSWAIGGADGNGALLFCERAGGAVVILPGEALAPTLTAAALDAIVEETIAPALADSKLSHGIQMGYRALAILTCEHYGLEIPGALAVEPGDGSIWSPTTLVVFAVILIFSLRSMRLSRKYQDRYAKNIRPRRRFAIERADDEERAPHTPRRGEIERLKRAQLEELAEAERERAAQPGMQDPDE